MANILSICSTLSESLLSKLYFLSKLFYSLQSLYNTVNSLFYYTKITKTFHAYTLNTQFYKFTLGSNYFEMHLYYILCKTDNYKRCPF